MYIIDKGQHSILSLNIETKEVTHLPVNALNNPVAIDIDIDDNLMFWTDVGSNNIYKATLAGQYQQQVKALPTGEFIISYAFQYDTMQSIKNCW